MKLTELFTPQAIAANFTETHSNDIPYLGAGFFPAKKKAGLDLSWIKGKNGLPVSLKPSTFDTKATFRDRIGVSKIETEMPFFREGYHLKEKDRQEILRAKDTSDPYAQAVIDRIYDDVGNLVAGADVVPERMIWQLLAPDSGNVGISISANGVNYTYNYDPDEDWKNNNYTALTTNTDKWSAADSCDPIADLMEMQDTIEDSTGVRPDIAVMSRKTFNYLLKSAKVRSAILAQNPTANIFLTPDVVKAAISAILGIDIIVYTKKFKTEDGAATAFYPDNYVTLLSSGVTLGSTYYGTTPEEADLIGSNQANVAMVGTGIAVAQIVQPHPVNIETIVSEIVLPTYEGMDYVGVIKVA
jgi:hypothetical protein